MMAAYSVRSSLPSSTINAVKVRPPLKKLSGSAHGSLQEAISHGLQGSSQRVLKMFAKYHIFRDGRTDLPREPIGPRGSFVSRGWGRGVRTVILRSLITPCDFPGGGSEPPVPLLICPCTSPKTKWNSSCNLTVISYAQSFFISLPAAVIVTLFCRLLPKHACTNILCD